MSIGARIRQLRHQHQLSQEKLGELCGVSKGMVSQWESDIVTPPTDRLTELHRHLKFSYDWLISGVALPYSADDNIAIEISRSLGVQERRAWYRAGHALAEPEEGEGTNQKQ